MYMRTVCMQGTGVRRFANGNVYTGCFDMGEMHGRGSIAFKNGDVFEGSAVKNIIEGAARSQGKYMASFVVEVENAWVLVEDDEGMGYGSEGANGASTR